MDRVKQIWYLSRMRAAKVQASLRIHALNGWACAVKICHDGMLEDTNSLDGAQIWRASSLHTHCFQIKTVTCGKSSATIPLGCGRPPVTVSNEPLHDKTNKMAGAPSIDSDQPGHPPTLIRVFAVCMKKAQVLSYPLSTQRSLWSDWADAQADLSLRWVHMSFCWYCHAVAPRVH